MRYTKDKGLQALHTPQEIYEAAHAFAARILRNMILSTVPHDLIEDAVEACKATVKATVKDLAESRKKIADAFKALGIEQMQLQKFLGKQLKDLDADDVATLRGIYTAIKDGQAKAEDYFGTTAETLKKAEKPKEAEKTAKAAEKKEEPAPPPVIPPAAEKVEQEAAPEAPAEQESAPAESEPDDMF